MGDFSTVVKQFVIDYTVETMDPLMEHEVNGLDYRYVYGNERLSVNISPIPNGAGHIVESGTVGQQIRLYYHQDLRGTVDYLTSPVSQKVESWTHYNEWGEIVHNAVLKTGYRELDLVKNYTGHDFDAVLNMYYAKARMYDAENRRFVSIDPILDGTKYDLKEYTTEAINFTAYVYVKDNPLRWIDPLGESALAIAGAGVASGTFSIEGSVAITGGLLVLIEAILNPPDIPTLPSTNEEQYVREAGQLVNPGWKDARISNHTEVQIPKVKTNPDWAFQYEDHGYMPKYTCGTATDINRPVLTYNANNESVIELQQILTRYGYYSDVIDGNFGDHTLYAVWSFQYINGLEMDGSVGPLTWEKLLSADVLTASSKEAKSQGQMQQQVVRGQAPKEVQRVDPPHNRDNDPNSKPHIHFGDDKRALNSDGTWHDVGKAIPKITRKIAKWILENGWKLPIE